MSGGNRRLNYFTRERPVSSDFNRSQAFAARDRAEVLRRQLCTRVNTTGTTQFIETGSYADTIASDLAPVGTPIVADVLDGLVVVPVPSSLNLIVTPGAIALDDPDGLPGSSDPDPPSDDDSRYKVVIDPGVQVIGALTIAPGSGSTRIDLVECQRTTTVLETDSRDILDPSTGQFNPLSVSKVDAGRLTYRVRQGTPGAGIPSLAQGWLPLCVASVPSSATTVDAMTFWDVRPLIKDRVNAPFESRHVTSRLEQSELYANDHTDASKCTLSGVVTSSIGMYRCGGLMPAGPGIIDVRDVANQASGYTPTVGRPWYLYSVFPANLPRWVRYVDAPAARVPIGPLGILAVSEQGPSSQLGIDDVRNPPAATGLGTPGPCALLAAGVVGSGPAEKGFASRGDGMILVNPDTAITAAPASATSTTDHYSLTPNQHFPLSARSVLVAITTRFTGTPAALDFVDANVMVTPPGGTARVAQPFAQRFNFTYFGGGTASVTFSCEVPALSFGTLNGEASDAIEFQVEWGNAVATRDLKSCKILGWRL